MSKLTIKIFSIIAIFSLFISFFATPTLADINYEISGNGADSSSEINVDQNQTIEVTQTNEANIENNVSVNANTGGNSADGNTGGDTSITTGDATVSTNISNTANSNVATINNCCQQNSSAEISGNGADSNNTLNISSTNNTNVSSSNYANVSNNVNVSANTGYNTADKNTGGDVSINTGDARFHGGISNTVNSNFANVSSGMGTGFDTKIAGNGSDSDNEINLDFENETDVRTRNFADIVNRAFFNFNTGRNSADKNTGGDVTIDTGDVFVDFKITNKANVNVVKVDNCCVSPTSKPTPTATPSPKPDDKDDDKKDEDKKDDDKKDEDKGAGTTTQEPPRGGQILGLGPTGGDYTSIFRLLTILGMLSLAYGVATFRKSNPSSLLKSPIILPNSTIKFGLAWQKGNPQLVSLYLQVSLSPRQNHSLRLVKI